MISNDLASEENVLHFIVQLQLRLPFFHLILYNVQKASRSIITLALGILQDTQNIHRE